MKIIVKFVVVGSFILNVESYLAQDFSSYKGMYWHNGIVAEVQAHYPGQTVEKRETYYDTGGVAAVLLVLKS